MASKSHVALKAVAGNSELNHGGVAAARRTERNLAEYGLDAKHPWFASLFEISPVAHLLMDENWNLVDANPSARKLLNLNGLSAEADRPIHARQFIGEIACEELAAHFNRQEAGKATPYEARVSLPLPAGDAGHLQLTCINMPASDQGSIHYVWIITAPNNKSKLHFKEPEAIRAKSDFLAMMSHEIRTPMNSIVGFSELMRSTCINEEQEMYLEQIESSAYVLLNLLNDILDFSKIDSGGVEIKNKQFNLVEQLQNLADELSACVAEKGLSLNIKVDSRMPLCVEVDDYCISQIIRNLLSNAVKFTDEGKISIEVDFIGQEREYVRYALHVVDTGIGIAQVDQARVFQVFSQIDNSCTRKHGGTGLGLAISRKLARILGGELTVKSELGQGARFTLYLTSKVLGGQDTATDPENSIKLPDAEDAEEFGPFNSHLSNSIRILLVEDDDVNQLLFVTMLGRLGFKAEIASNGQEALHHLQDEYYDLVFMDLQMPKMGGLEVALRTRQNRNQHQPYLVAVTANTGVEVMEMCFNAGMDDFLSKPLTQQGIVQAIRKYRERRSF